MRVWWIGEAIPLPLTALLVPVLGVILKITTPKNAFAPFANAYATFVRNLKEVL